MVLNMRKTAYRRNRLGSEQKTNVTLVTIEWARVEDADAIDLDVFEEARA